MTQRGQRLAAPTSDFVRGALTGALGWGALGLVLLALMMLGVIK